jgi:alkaline phosphatase
MKKAFLFVLSITLISACSSSVLNNISTKVDIDEQKPKNIIMVIADGMGPAYTTAYRYYRDNVNTPEIESTVFDRNMVGTASTYPASVSNYVTDSAAAATALSSGVKTYNGAIAVDMNKNAVETVLEWAKKQGKKTGVVVTSQINHATPAAYLTHNEHRGNYNAIADSYIDNGIKADLYLGGGWQYFIRQDRHLVNEFKQAGFHYIDNYSELSNAPQNKPLLGLFADKGLPGALDDNDKYRLSTMTKAATAHLENDRGYFLLVEASQVDWAGHNNDVNYAMSEMDDLSQALIYLEEYVRNNPDTLVVVTADHSTGGLTLGAEGIYQWNSAILHKLTRSIGSIAQELLKQTEEISLKQVSLLLHMDITEDELAVLNANKRIESEGSITNNLKFEATQKLLYKALNQLIDKKTVTGWTSGGHTGIDVPVLAWGAASDRFLGFQDNTDIAKNIFDLLGKKD